LDARARAVIFHGTMNERQDDAWGCRNSGMPLGGIGAGSLEIRPDGCFYNWNLMNNRPWGAGSPTAAMERVGLRFALCFQAGAKRRCLALSTHNGLDAKDDGWFWMSDPYHLPWVEHARDIVYRARIPFADLDYDHPDSPLKVSLRAWSPLIPGQAEDSNTPGAVLTFTIQNTSDEPVGVGLMGLLKNAVGYDRPELVSKIELVRGDMEGLVFSRIGQDARASSAGTMGLFVSVDAPHDISHAIHPRHGRDLFDPLLSGGRLEDTDYGRKSGAVGEIGAEKEADGPRGMQRGAVAAHFDLAGGKSIACTFHLTWSFPNFWELDRPNASANLLGHQYSNRFADATAVARFLRAQHDRLLAASAQFCEAFYRSSLPPWELNAINASFSVLLRAAWWDKSGRFGIWEGLGCCGLQTIDVGHYASFPIVQLFPQLDVAQNELSAANLEPSGKVPHNLPGRFDVSDYSAARPRGRIDLGPQFILAVWRNALWTGKLDHARRMWPVIQRNLQWMQETDTDGDGLPNNQGPDQTYDRFPLYGTSAYVGFLYIACLQAASELAGKLGDAPGAREYASRASRLTQVIDQQLWNGQYYNLSHDSGQRGTNEGCMTDQLNGDWFFRQSAGRGLLPDDRVREALSAVWRLNRRTAGPHAWLANCTWPRGGQIQITRLGSDQANCPWSGVEYAVAAHMILVGLRDEGRRVALDVFGRYDDAGMRFNHVECGEFYYRAMSAWALYLAEFGAVYDASEEHLRVAPPKGKRRLVLPTPTGLLEIGWNGEEGNLSLSALTGQIRLRRASVHGVEAIDSPTTLTRRNGLVVQVAAARELPLG
jgi:uncharacterized protein (DUF608 family)